MNIGAAKCRSEADGQFPTVRADTCLKLIGADKNIKAFDERLCSLRQVNFTDIGDGTGSIAFADGVGSPQNQVLDDQRNRAGNIVVLCLGECSHSGTQLFGGQFPLKFFLHAGNDIFQRSRPLRKVIADLNDTKKVSGGLRLKIVSQIDRNRKDHRLFLLAQRDFLGKSNQHHRGKHYGKGGIIGFCKLQNLLDRHDSFDDFESALRHTKTFELAGFSAFGSLCAVVRVIIFGKAVFVPF